MKSKYFPIVTTGLALAVIIAVGSFGLSWFSNAPALAQNRTPMTASAQAMPSNEQVQTVQQLEPLLADLASPTGKPAKGLPLTLFGDHIPDDGGAGQTMARHMQTDHRLSLTLVSGPNRFCVVDGEFLAEGDQLPDGSRIFQIKNQTVLIGNATQTKWLRMDDPFAPQNPQVVEHTHPGKDRS